MATLSTITFRCPRCGSGAEVGLTASDSVRTGPNEVSVKITAGAARCPQCGDLIPRATPTSDEAPGTQPRR